MWIALMVLALPCVIVVAAVRALSQRAGPSDDKTAAQGVAARPEAADDYPAYSEPSQRREGDPVPGSRDHRRQHGQP